MNGMHPTPRPLVTAVLILGAFTTMATSLAPPTSLEADHQVILHDDTPVRVTLLASKDVVDQSDDIQIRVHLPENSAQVRVVPDPPNLPILELPTSDGYPAELYDLQDSCQREGDCSIGFTIELVDGGGPLEVLIEGTALDSTDPGFFFGDAAEEYNDDAVFKFTEDTRR